METEVVFTLPAVLTYMHGGNAQNETLELILVGPSYNNRKFARTLSQRVKNALFALSAGQTSPPPERDVAQEETPITGAQIVDTLTSCDIGLFNWDEFLDWFWGAAVKNHVVFVAEDVPLTPQLCEKVNALDSARDLLEEIAGAYIANFTWPSLLPTDDG